MTKKIIFNVRGDTYKILLLEDNEIVEYHEEKKKAEYIVGDIFTGKVQRVVSGLNAAFVKIGHERDAFLHYFDLSPSANSMAEFIRKANEGSLCDVTKMSLAPPTDKDGKISSTLKAGQKVIVQVAKEAIHSKGLRISSSISLPGCYLIIVPFGNEIFVSRKISGAKERSRLEQLVTSIRPNNFTIIVRTAAKGKDVATLNEDLQSLVNQWEEGVKTFPKSEPGHKLISELRAPCAILRDTLDECFDQIIVDDKETYKEIQDYLGRISSDKQKLVNCYEGKKNVFEYLTITKKLDALLGKVVRIEKGGYLVIEQTEALCSIDVNTGSSVKGGATQENIVLQVNLAAAKEIARQLRLRDIGGLIVVDFIDMKDPAHKKQVLQTMKKALKVDKAKSDILPLNKFCLMQLTRSRVRPAIIKEDKERCPTCQGSGKIQSSLSLIDFLEEQLKFLLTEQKLQKITIRVHPYVYTFLYHSFLEKKWTWILSYWQGIQIVSDEKLAVTDYQILNKQKEILARAPVLKHLNKQK